MVDHTTVLIVGAGPAGLVLGNLLRAEGIDTLVVERASREQVRTRARAGFLGPNSARVLTQHGLGAATRTRTAPERPPAGSSPGATAATASPVRPFLKIWAGGRARTTA